MFDDDEPTITQKQKLYCAHYDFYRHWLMAYFIVNTTVPRALAYMGVPADVICQVHLARLGLAEVMGIASFEMPAGDLIMITSDN